MTRPLVSCVVPAFNSERHVGEAVQSILDQTYAPLEVVVVDDGSSDGTRDVVGSFGDRVRLIRQDDGGPAATRNRGVRSSRGDLLAFLDADDLWHPEKLERQWAELEARPDLDFCLTHVQMFWPDEMSDEEERFRGHRRSDPVPGFATITLLARRRVFDVLGAFDDGLWFTDATDWFVRARELGVRMSVLDETLVYHRMHPGNLTRRREQESREEFLAMIKRSLDRRRSGSA